jgi:hypothetical protein
MKQNKQEVTLEELYFCCMHKVILIINREQNIYYIQLILFACNKKYMSECFDFMHKPETLIYRPYHFLFKNAKI